jgi:hypothetical protein
VAKTLNARFQFVYGAPTIRAVIANCPVVYQLKHDEPYISFFQNGVWVETYEPADFSTEDIENYARSVVMALQHAVKYKGAEPTGRVSQWTPTRVQHLMSLIRQDGLRLPRRNTKEGGILSYSTGNSGWGGLNLFVRLTSEPDDSLTVSMTFDIARTNAEIRVRGHYLATTSDEEIAQDVKRQIVEQLLQLQQEGSIARPSMFVKLTRFKIDYPFQDKPTDPEEVE